MILAWSMGHPGKLDILRVSVIFISFCLGILSGSADLVVVDELFRMISHFRCFAIPTN
jgi:hypothetical protein